MRDVASRYFASDSGDKLRGRCTSLVHIPWAADMVLPVGRVVREGTPWQWGQVEVAGIGAQRRAKDIESVRSIVGMSISHGCAAAVASTTCCSLMLIDFDQSGDGVSRSKAYQHASC